MVHALVVIGEWDAAEQELSQAMEADGLAASIRRAERRLRMLERAGEITFKPHTIPWSATTSDIASNPHDFHFVFIDYGAGPRTLGSVDAVIAYNMQFISAGTPAKDKIYAPPAPRSFAGQLVVGTKYRYDPQVKKLIKVFFAPRVQAYLRTTTNPGLEDQLTPVAKS